MNFLQKAIKRKALKQTKDAIRMIEIAKRNGTVKPEIADGLLKQLKASMEGVDDEKK